MDNVFYIVKGANMYCTYCTVHLSTRYRYQKSVHPKSAIEYGLAICVPTQLKSMLFFHQLSQNKGSVTSES